MEKIFTTEEIRNLYNRFFREEISFSEMVEIMNERVSGANEPQYKDGDFVVNECGVIIIFKNKVGSYIYDHAYFSEAAWVVVCSDSPTTTPIRGYATEEQKKKILDELAKEGKRWNEEEKCIEDIPVRKFKKGDKVMLKSGYKKDDGEITYDNFFDRYIDKPLTVVGYTMNGYISLDEHIFPFSEDWLEPYEELKEGDLAIFWDSDKRRAFIGEYDHFQGESSSYPHIDNKSDVWKNAIKFESVEQYRKLLKGEI